MKNLQKIAILPFLLLVVSFGIAQQLTRTNNQIQNVRISQNQWLDVKGVKFSEISDMEIKTPVSHKNLTLYLITGITKFSTANYLRTLDEALKNKNALVIETSEVNQLSVKNTSKSQGLFINSSDIVKGGKQDRTLVYDLWVPKNTETTLESFCIEAGRWSQRDEESVGYFSGNSYGLSSRKLKIAATVNNSQSEVWEKVSEQQDGISNNIKVDVKSEKSKSSLQLTLENKDLQKKIETYKKAFSSFGATNNAIGFAYAINGELFGINYYNSPVLFKKLKEKLLTAVFVEAISEKEKKTIKKLTPYEIQKIMDAMIDNDSTQYKINNKYNLSLKWTHKDGYMIESRIQKDNKNKVDVSDFKSQNWIHRSYLFNPK